MGKMVITKVVGYNLVKLEPWKWDLAYQIQVLLVMPSTQHRQVQEWSILRTANDLNRLLQQLQLEFSSDTPSSSSAYHSTTKATKQKLAQQVEKIGSLPALIASQRKEFLDELTLAMATLDSVMRCFCMDASVVNSQPMKRFLGLHPSCTTTENKRALSSVTSASLPMSLVSLAWGAFHDPTSLASQPKRATLHQSIDQYVKQ